MRIETSLLAKLRSTLSGSSSSRSQGTSLTPGSLAEVLVTAKLDQDRILFNIGSQELVAKNTAGLEIGQRVTVQIQPGQTEAGELILQVLTEPPLETLSAASKLKPLLTAKSDLGPLLKELRDVLAELPARPGSSLEKAAGQVRTSLARALVRPDLKLESSLKNLSSRLGLDYEANLARAASKEGASQNSGQLKPALLALAKELRPILNQVSLEGGNPSPALTNLAAELREALTLLAGRPEGQATKTVSGEPTPTQPGPAQPGPDQVPGQETRPAPAPLPTRDGPPLKEALRLPRAAAIPVDRDGGEKTGTQAPSRESGQGLAQNLGRLKGALIRKAVRILERELFQRGEKETGPSQALIKAEVARTVRTIWPRTAQDMTRPEPAPQALAARLETALHSTALRLGALSQVQTQAVLTGTEEALRGLEMVQLLNAVAMETATSLVLPLPLAPAWGAESGRVFFYKPPHKQTDDQGEQPLRLVFLLDMTRLGPVRVDVSMVKKNLMINLYLSKAGALKQVSAKLGGLEKTLSGMGYHIRSLSARAVKNAPPLEEVAPRAVEARPRGFIDLKT